ncbi:DNA-binding CsgD family transcriptional regulator/tetratricopeptide (TPR) repeat protein [Actinokineospora baliensis]|uniref:BREX system ATP-binding domain-containing protein n=1 Tax=Actinokineospora baliensis TaxID=547056 RepID=UPI00195D379C|nr:LuxR family transcriptional regulator [Actinokineospora baliensis]MBM7773735.1 DNA-binding CsgD family transcriptional regulator/tetratricopeptide (TPR) repeat protein [Actinokineospora baliensis]
MGRPAREPLVGRERELSALQRSLDALVTGQAVVVAVHGEPGTGKTRLLAELAERADSLGVDVRFAAVSRPPSERISEHCPSVLVIDDAHAVKWAEWLETLLRAPSPGPVLVAVAYRDGCHWLPAALARSPWQVTRLSPGPLDAADVAALLPGTPRHMCAQLVAASGGNPLYLSALTGHSPEAVLLAIDPRGIGETPLPDGVLAVAASEVLALDEVRREVAYAVAASGAPADVDVVVRVAGLPEAVVLRALDDLVASGLVRAHGSRIAFRHPLVRAAAYQSAGVTWRTRAHRRAGEYLRLKGGPLPLQAFHAARAASYGDAEAARTLASAAEVVLDSAPTTAAAWVDRAIQVLPYGTGDQLLPLLGRALGLGGNLLRARDVLHTSLANGQSGPEVVRACARTERLLGRYTEAEALLARAGTAGVAAERAAVALLLGDPAGCVGHARHAIAEGDEVAGHVLLALGSVRAGETSAYAAWPAVRLVDGLPDAAVGDHLAGLAWVELALDRTAEAARHVQRGVDIARATGRRSSLPELLAVEAGLALRSGHLDQVRVSCREAHAVAVAMGSVELAALASAVELPAILWQNGPEDALAAAPSPRSPWWAEIAGLTVAEAHLAMGDFTACVGHITASVGTDLSRASGQARGTWAGHLAIAMVGLGRAEEAAGFAEEAVRGSSVIGHFAQSYVFAALGRSTAARDEAARAITGSPVRRARARELLAEHLAAEGDLTAARAELGQAKEGYLACGATWLSARVRFTETRLGARAPRPRRPHGTVEALSGRELEVAELVASGLTNREVATRLFLSRKTVEGHLARVFTKLGVKSRMGVAQRLAARSS